MTALEPVDALRKNRAVLEAYVDLGLMFLERGQPDAALHTLEKVLAANPRDHEALAAMTRTLAMLGKS